MHEAAAAPSVLVALPVTRCPPAVPEPLARALAGEVRADPVPWLTERGQRRTVPGAPLRVER